MLEAVDLNDPKAVIETLGEAASLMRGSEIRHGSCVMLPSRGRLLATGDLHDNILHYRKVIAMARLDRSDDHHVVLHELIHGDKLINGMDFSYRMLVRVAELVRARPRQVHPMLANHELSQLTGRGVSKGAGNSVELFIEALQFVFGDAWEEVNDALNDFIAAMPLAVRSPSGVLCAHSLPNAMAMKHFDTSILDRELTDEDRSVPSGGAHHMVWGRTYTNDSVAQLAQAWDVRLFVLGHCHVETGAELIGECVIVLNTDHERATVIPIDLADIPSPTEALMSAVPLQAVTVP